jgi:hypothetical protein
VATAKKKTTAKTTRKAKTTAQKSVKSFRVAKPASPFFHFDFTIQTVYWLILGALFISVALWIASLNLRIQSLYDQIDQTNEMIIMPDTVK